MSATVETFQFQTEARELLDLMIHSVYSNKEIFLRELISNASDALDKRRFEAVQNPDLLPEGTELHILLDADPSARTLTVADTGIGMSRDELVEILGTIAKSGSREFAARLKEAQASESPELIGQFGVGFYSTFMVADKVTVLTRRAGEDTAWQWESSGDGTFTLQPAERNDAGTTVTMHLKPVDTEDKLEDYAEQWVLRKIVKQYSDFVAYPIEMDVTRKEVERDDEGKPVEGAEEKEVTSRETLNSMKAIWLRDKDEVSEEDFNEFYKHISHDWTDPLYRIQAKIEGTLEYRMLLYIPSTAPFDLYYRDAKRHGVHLYVKRVFIMDDCTELLPDYLRFVRGVVDSEDLSLNISREILQQDRQITRMRNGIVSKVLSSLKTMHEKETDTFETLWSTFGRVLKEGIFQDRDNQERVLELAHFVTTNSDGKPIPLATYLERMPESQDAIYYITGENLAQLENSPHLEAFRAKGYEVLLLTDPVDEVWTQQVPEFKEKPLRSAAKGAVDLGTEEEKKQAEEERKEKEKGYSSLFQALQKNLDEHVKEVRFSARLTDSPACVVGDTFDMTPQMEQMMKAMGQEMPPTKRILELNPLHPLIEKLQAAYDQDGADGLGEWATLLYGQAMLAEGGAPPDTAVFSKALASLMVKAI